MSHSRFFLFPLKSGRKRLTYGVTQEEALETLSYRCTPEEMDEIDHDKEVIEVAQQDIHPYLKKLG